ncbi:hypothetical protein ACFWR9_16475 [Streptomyces sp. NPDC058534]|uniref:hypothetical protein n=1 Tax=Streptomyces sp. NPDC058534 TaxID=3346541 RepID=UPI00365CD3FD
MGIAAAGVIAPVTGTVTSATDTIRGWAGTALTAPTGLPVACDNDVCAVAATELSPTDAPDASLVYAVVGSGTGVRCGVAA